MAYGREICFFLPATMRCIIWVMIFFPRRFSHKKEKDIVENAYRYSLYIVPGVYFVPLYLLEKSEYSHILTAIYDFQDLLHQDFWMSDEYG